MAVTESHHPIGVGSGWSVEAVRSRLAAEATHEAVREKRRGVGQKVREVRERLTSTSGTRPAFDVELARLYAHNRLSATNVAMALTIIAGGLLVLWLPPFAAVAWTAAVLATQLVIGRLAGRFIDAGEVRTLGGWLHRFALVEFLSATAVACLVPLTAGWAGHGSLVFLFSALVVAAVLVTALAASVPTVVYAGTLPITAMAVGFFLARGGATATHVAILAPLAQICLIFLGRRLFQSSLLALQFRAEMDALVGELERATAISEEARRRAETANVAKSRFLATMSHELRTPLNAILGFSEVMKNEVFGTHANQTYKDYASDIHTSGEHLLNLINELLDLSRIEAGRYELNEEAINLVHLVEDCRHLLKLRAQNRGIEIRELYEPQMPRLWADERAVRQVVLNLLSNAIKFTPQGGEIRLTVGWTDDGGQYVSVVDTGPGIPEEEIPVVLSSFGQGSLALKTAEQGAGLGLPIVKGLVDLHGGNFVLKSKLREGTEVVITFPPSRVMDPLPPMQEPAAAPSLREAG
ncbi:MAG TPA: HAMP domain-containing sensor histidine kinase [Hyphomicrobiales bacterium]|nr:HAMP domain-containing sensor histidine kinase [Hyphomicrobiales bacterium]